MTGEFTTTFENRCYILQELWVSNRDHPDLQEFIEFNDLGLPLAYLLDAKIVDPTQAAEKFINEAWSMLLSTLGILDEGWEELEEMLDRWVTD